MKSFLTLALALCSTTAFAQHDWRKISETQDGKSLLVDVKSADFTPSNGVSYAGALFRYVPGEGVFAFVVEAAGCIKGQGQIYYRVRENNQWVTKNEYWFTLKDGTRMYDDAARVLCTAYSNALKQSNQPPEREQQSAI